MTIQRLKEAQTKINEADKLLWKPGEVFIDELEKINRGAKP
jgi:hypothetical protein